jgi:hypothetical protein
LKLFFYTRGRELELQILGADWIGVWVTKKEILQEHVVPVARFVLAAAVHSSLLWVRQTMLWSVEGSDRW